MKPFLPFLTYRRNPALALLVVALLCGSVSLSSGAATKVLRVWPDQFEASNSVQASFQQPGILWALFGPGDPGAPFSNVNFHKVIELRPGQQITGVTYYHAGFGSSAYTVVSLHRLKMGGQPESLASGSSNAVTQGPLGAGILPVDLTITSSNLTVENGYRYYLTANVDNKDAAVYGVEVQYR